jgi:hypothetical protein
MTDNDINERREAFATHIRQLVFSEIADEVGQPLNRQFVRRVSRRVNDVIDRECKRLGIKLNEQQKARMTEVIVQGVEDLAHKSKFKKRATEAKAEAAK